MHKLHVKKMKVWLQKSDEVPLERPTEQRRRKQVARQKPKQQPSSLKSCREVKVKCTRRDTCLGQLMTIL